MDTALDGHGHITGVECAPLPEPDLRDLDREADEALAGLGLPPRPRGRLWLLRPVGPFTTLGALLDHLDDLAGARAVEARPSAAFLALAREELAALAALAAPEEP